MAQADYNIRKFKRGEVLFKEGDRAQHVYIVQSGRVSIYLSRGNQKFETMQLTTGQIVGEGAILGGDIRQLSAEAISETTVIEVPLVQVRALLEGSHNVIKILFKSMHEKLRVASNDLKNFRLEKETVPCPQMVVPKVFSIINFVARYLAKKDKNSDALVLLWSTLHIASVRLFLESRDRMYSVLELLHKLGHVEMVMHKNDDNVEELNLIQIKNLQLLEDFSEFYQFNLYKGGKSEIIYVDHLALQVAEALAELGKGQPLDRHGAVRLDYNKLLNDLKEKYQINFKPLHLQLLEKKGLFMDRKVLENGSSVVCFDFNEYVKTVAYWRIIQEIDRWNERGKVVMVEKVTPTLPVANENAILCRECQQVLKEDVKFCSNCGVKVAA